MGTSYAQPEPGSADLFRVSAGFRNLVDDICKLAAKVCDAEVACLVMAPRQSDARLLGSYGSTASALRGNGKIPNIDPGARAACHFKVLARHNWFAGHPLSSIAPFARELLVLPIPQPNATCEQIYFAVFYHGVINGQNPIAQALLPDLLQVTQAILARELEDVRRDPIPTASFEEGAGPAALSATAVSTQSLLDFLDKTLVRKRDLHDAIDINYVTLRRWRAAAKPVQAEALMALAQLTGRIDFRGLAQEFAETIGSLIGHSTPSGVVPMKGSEKLDDRTLELTSAVASIIGVPLVDCLEVETVSRHRQTFKILPDQSLKGHLILLDLHASNGKRFNAATSLLVSAGASASSFAWLNSESNSHLKLK